MKVEKIIERKDGSADVTFLMSKQEADFLIEYAIINILKEHIKTSKKVKKNEKEN